MSKDNYREPSTPLMFDGMFDSFIDTTRTMREKKGIQLPPDSLKSVKTPYFVDQFFDEGIERKNSISNVDEKGVEEEGEDLTSPDFEPNKVDPKLVKDRMDSYRVLSRGVRSPTCEKKGRSEIELFEKELMDFAKKFEGKEEEKSLEKIGHAWENIKLKFVKLEEQNLLLRKTLASVLNE